MSRSSPWTVPMSKPSPFEHKPDPGVGAVLALSFLLALVGCATPDLRPFADASGMLSTSVKRGGELAIAPVEGLLIWSGEEFTTPQDPGHPYQALKAEWDARRDAMDAVVIYSASLQAISDACAKRQGNASSLLESVQQLASSVPGYGIAFDAAGTLLVQGMETTLEVKAWRDLRRAVDSADPAIQLIAGTLLEDFKELAILMEAPLNDHIAALGARMRPVGRLERALRNQRDAQRGLVANDPGDGVKGAELARLEFLHQSALSDWNQLQKQRTEAENALRQGREFFAYAAAGVEAWANAHATIRAALIDRRSPDLTLLAVRAEELREAASHLKQR
jgi:hypothetical protein